MKRMATQVVVLLLAIVGAPYLARAADDGREIGYVESFDHKAEFYVLHHGEQSLPVAVMTPVRTGDRIEVRDPTAKIVLRLVNHATPVVVSQGNLDTPLLDTPPARAFWTPLIAWTGLQIGSFERHEREQVSASIRSAPGESVPILKVSQTLPAGRQSLAIGWIGSARADIHLVGPHQQDIALGQGGGGLFLGPQIDLAAGDYVLDVLIDRMHVRQQINVVSAAAMPQLPPDLASDGIPASLREVAIAAWLAGLDRRFMLAGLQHVAPLAGHSEPARLLASALARGDRPRTQP